MQQPRIIVPMGIREPQGDEGELVYIKSAYIHLVNKAGGMAVTVSPQEEFDPAFAMESEGCGLLIIGGGDMDSALYGQSRHPKINLSHRLRQKSDMDWFRWADEREMPVLGICLGCQVINVARGGTLIQHLPDVTDIVHSRSGREYAHHTAEIFGQKLSSIITDSNININSSHHQAVQTPGKNLQVAARAPDGTVEAVEDPGDRFVVGLQWHPEDMAQEKSTKSVMAAFLNAASTYRSSRITKV